jgi:hypothetical protein
MSYPQNGAASGRQLFPVNFQSESRVQLPGPMDFTHVPDCEDKVPGSTPPGHMTDYKQ